MTPVSQSGIPPTGLSSSRELNLNEQEDPRRGPRFPVRSHKARRHMMIPTRFMATRPPHYQCSPYQPTAGRTRNRFSTSVSRIPHHSTLPWNASDCRIHVGSAGSNGSRLSHNGKIRYPLGPLQPPRPFIHRLSRGNPSTSCQATSS